LNILDKRDKRTYDLIEHIETIINSDENNRALQKYIEKLLRDEELLPNYGQLFEITAYSILHVYFACFNFTLKRFSTSFSNDGGMDYIAENGIYQVTTAVGKSKILSDLEKLPEIPRVIVITKTGSSIDKLLKQDNITEVITLDDLCNHFIPWLARKSNGEKNGLRMVLRVFLNEINRDLY